MIENLTIKDIREIKEMFSGKENNFPSYPPHLKVGMKVFVRTVTNIFLGELQWMGAMEFTLTKCSWVADTGRFHECIKYGIENISSSEIEPYPPEKIVSIGRGSLIDGLVEWDHDLPTSTK